MYTMHFVLKTQLMRCLLPELCVFCYQWFNFYEQVFKYIGIHANIVSKFRIV